MAKAHQHTVNTVQRQHNAQSSTSPIVDWVIQRVRLYAQRRTRWLRYQWAVSTNEAEPTDNAPAEIDTYLANMEPLENEWVWYETTEEIQSLNRAIEQINKKVTHETTSRLYQLITDFGLSQPDIDIVHACLAIAVEPNFGRIYAYLHDNSTHGYVSESLVARLFGHGYLLPINTHSPLKTWRLITTHEMGRSEPARLELSPYIRNWLLGLTETDELLLPVSQLLTVHSPLANWPIQETVKYIKGHTNPRPLRIFIKGAEGSGRRSFAAIVAQKCMYSLRAVQADRLADADLPTGFLLAQRMAVLHQEALLWQGDLLLDRHWPYLPLRPTAHVLQFVIGEVGDVLKPDPNYIDYQLELPPLSPTESVQLWNQHVATANHWPSDELALFAKRRHITIGNIMGASGQAVKTLPEAIELVDNASRQRLAGLAQHLKNDFTWHDLVLPAHLGQLLDDFAFEARQRTAIWENPETRRLFPQGKGLFALFTGSPGTGKTMAAQVIANSLKLDLYRIDLSTVVSKYIGETAKNLQQILARAEQMDVCLFFDEADALFGKRTEVKDAHDRYANTDTNYLLQAIEEYSGLAILASNRNADIDKGFTRRFRYILDFPKPDTIQRVQLWQRMVGQLCGTDRAKELDKDLIQFAAMFDITGAQIKHAVLTAIYLAKQEHTLVLPRQLVSGVERELKMKEGRGLSRQAQELWK